MNVKYRCAYRLTIKRKFVTLKTSNLLVFYIVFHLLENFGRYMVVGRSWWAPNKPLLILANKLTLYQGKGGRGGTLCRLSTLLLPPGFSDLSTALRYSNCFSRNLPRFYTTYLLFIFRDIGKTRSCKTFAYLSNFGNKSTSDLGRHIFKLE